MYNQKHISLIYNIWTNKYKFSENPVTPGDFPVLLYCKNNNCKWVCQKIDTLIKPLLSNIKNDNFKATLFVLIGNILSQFREKSNLEYTESTKDWLKALTKGKGSLTYFINHNIRRSTSQLKQWI